MKLGREYLEEEGPPGVSDGVCRGIEMEAFNARYPGGSVGVIFGVSSVPMGA